MQKANFDSKLMTLLESNPDFVDAAGHLLRAAVRNAAWQLDHSLIQLLLSDAEIRDTFFEDIDGYSVFNHNRFVDYITDKNFFADSYTRFRNKIGLNIDGKFLSERGEVSLVWPYKDCVLEGGQTREAEKRQEIFFNEVLAQDEITRLYDPKVLTNWKRHTNTTTRMIGGGGESALRRDENGIIRENLIVKGNNLIALHSLKQQFRGQVKLIYIDPPYNPNSQSNTFMYNNNFKRSSWLTFMRNRLEIAKDLLKEDGSIIVAIDENERDYLGILLDEVFPEHEKHCITIVHNPRGVQGKNFSYTHEYAFFILPKGESVISDREIPEEKRTWSNFRNWGGESKREDAKNCFYPVIVENHQIVGFGDVLDDDEHPTSQTVCGDGKSYVYPIDGKGVERKWRYARQSVDKIKHLLRAKETETGYQIQFKKDFEMCRTVWIDEKYDANKYGTQLIKSLVPACAFDFPKSLWNVYDCLSAVIDDDQEAVVLDFFGGSGTTAHAVLELNKRDAGNRKFILVEQMDYVESVTVPRVQKVIEESNADNFIYCELMQYNQAYMDKIQAAQSSEALVALWREIAEHSVLNWYVNPKTPEEAVNDFIAIDDIDTQKQLLAELLDKNQLYVNLSEIEDTSFGISETDKSLNAAFYFQGVGL